MTLKGLRLGVSKRPYLQRFIEMVTQGELLKLHHFLPAIQTLGAANSEKPRDPRHERNSGPRKTIDLGIGSKENFACAWIYNSFTQYSLTHRSM